MIEIGSEFSLCSNDDYFFSRIRNFGKKAIFLRCGRDALGYIAGLIKKKSGIILMPAYCCNSMVDPFVLKGWKIIYYPINSGLSIEEEYLISICEKNKPDAILTMNFFGLSDTKPITNLIKTKYPDIQIVEDITHTLLDIENSYTENVDFYIGSIRKWMGITDGALVISTKKEIQGIEYIENEFVSIRLKGLNVKEDYRYSQENSIKLKYRKILLEAEKVLENGKIPYSISPASQKLLDNLNVGSLRNARKKNASNLLRLLKTIPEIDYPGNIESILDFTPFSLPILVKNRDNIQKKMAEKGVYAALLWPLNMEARKESPFAAKIEDLMLSIPIDQRYDADDMEYIYNVIKELVI